MSGALVEVWHILFQLTPRTDPQRLRARAGEVLQEALDAMAVDTEQRELLLAQRDSLRERLDRVRQDARQHKDHAHQLAVRLGSLKAQYDSTRPALERLEMQYERLTEQREERTSGVKGKSV